MLTEGYDSRSLRILASLGRLANSFEAENYYLRCLEELQVHEPAPETAVSEYACYLSQQILDGQLTSREGVRALYLLCQATDYAPEFMVWYELEEALDGLVSGDSPNFYGPMTMETFDIIVKQEAERFITKMTQTAE
jgi:hypothetical protein